MVETKKRKVEQGDDATEYMAMIILNDGSAEHCQVINISKFYNTEQAACQEILEDLAIDSTPLSCGSREKDIPVAEKINDAANRVLDSPKKCSALTIDRLQYYVCKWVEAAQIDDSVGYHCKLVKRDNLKTVVEGYQVCTDSRKEVEVVSKANTTSTKTQNEETQNLTTTNKMADKPNFKSFDLTELHIYLSRHLEFHSATGRRGIMIDPLEPFANARRPTNEEEFAKQIRDIAGLRTSIECSCNSSLCRPCIDEAMALFKSMATAINIILRCGPKPGKYLNVNGVWELREPCNSNYS